MVWIKEELTLLADISLENNIIIISDEIHSDLVFDGNKHIPIATISDKVAENCMICMAPSKTFNTAGFSTSIVIIPDKMKWMKYETALNVGHIGMGNIFGSVALEAAYTHGDEWLSQMLAYLWNNYMFLEKYISENLPKIKVMKPEATYLIWLDFREYGKSEKELLDLIVGKARVGINNGSRFGKGGNGWFRINIGCPQPVLKEALENLRKVFKDI